MTRAGSGAQAMSVQTREQHEVVEGDAQIGLAGTGVAAAEGEGDFDDGVEIGASQDIEQDFEAGLLQDNAVDGGAADDEES